MGEKVYLKFLSCIGTKTFTYFKQFHYTSIEKIKYMRVDRELMLKW